MMNFFLYLFEFGTISTFFLILRKERMNKRLFEILILAFLFGMILESINAPVSQAYYYSEDFLFAVFNIPIAIGAGWAIVYYSTKKIAARFFNLQWFQKPFIMALLALGIDIILDPIAIRLGFWTWRIPLDQEFFGVPYDNFVGWMAAIWTFAFFVNFSEGNFIKEKTSKVIKYAAVIISPILLSLQITIYVMLSALFSGKFSFQEIIGFYQKGDFSYAYAPEVQAWKLYFFVLIVLFLIVYSIKTIITQKRAIH